MTEKQATRRYHMGLIPAMVIFMGGSLGLAWLDNNADLARGIMVGLSSIPVIALLSMFYLHWRFLNEVDEFLRQIQVNALLFGAAVVLTVATGWGYWENYVDAPALPIFWLNPIFWLGYGAAALVLTKRAGGLF